MALRSVISGTSWPLSSRTNAPVSPFRPISERLPSGLRSAWESPLELTTSRVVPVFSSTTKALVPGPLLNEPRSMF
jgi:hypothetical protein